MKKTRLIRTKKEKLVIVKPYLRFSAFINIIDELITYNMRERVLLLSSPKDGFDFYDDDMKRNQENHRIICIKNEFLNSIHSINIDMQTKLITESEAVIEDKYSNFVKHLRHNEEIILRAYSTEQRNKIWEELNNGKQVKLYFSCVINYLTEANEQICYEYEAEIQSIPVKREDGNSQVYVCDNSKINIIKDEYKILNEVTVVSSTKASAFRNIQDYITIDRANYIHQKIGAAQARGLISQIGLPFGNQNSQNSTLVNENT